MADDLLAPSASGSGLLVPARLAGPPRARAETVRLVFDEALGSSRRVLFGPGVVYCYSETAFVLGAVAKCVWHDDGDHCPTWTTAGCACDSEGVTL